jgi:ribosome-associated protein
MTDRETDETEAPSKSERKRVAHAAQELGEALIGLPDAELVALGLPEAVNDAVRAARSINSRSASARQRQYIGKLMRDLDLTPVRERLRARSEQASRDAERFKRTEAWRDRLINEGVGALDDLESWRPGLDRAQLTRLVVAARRERQEPDGNGRAGTAGRALFRWLAALFATTQP